MQNISLTIATALDTDSLPLLTDAQIQCCCDWHTRDPLWLCDGYCLCKHHTHETSETNWFHTKGKKTHSCWKKGNWTMQLTQMQGDAKFTWLQEMHHKVIISPSNRKTWLQGASSMFLVAAHRDPHSWYQWWATSSSWIKRPLQAWLAWESPDSEERCWQDKEEEQLHK